MIDWFISKGPVEGYKIEAVYADAQSKPDVAINEAVRLIEQEKVDMLLGFYSSAECVPAAARIEEFKKFMWITTCIASPVLLDRHLHYVFRPQPFGQQWGLTAADMVTANAKTMLGKDPKDVRVAIIHEDGAYGVDVAKGNENGSKKGGLNIVLNEGYSATAPDLSSLVTKLKRARPDVIFHTGYNPDNQPVPAPGARTRPAFQRADWSRRRLHRLYAHQAGGRYRRELFLRRGSNLDLGHQPESAPARIAADDPDDR